VKFVEYGNKKGQLVFYFHGNPGSIDECAIFENYAKDHNLHVICLERSSIESSFSPERYYQELSDQIKLIALGQSVDIIGFSIGTHVALEVSALLGDQVRFTHLISAVAPINAGDFIDNMAGGLVFKLAMEKPIIFLMLTQYQKFMALLTPRLLLSMLFASSIAKDKELSKSREFQRFIIPVLKNCFKNGTKGYLRDINLYVKWLGNLDKYTNCIHFWHGTSDNWSPFSMATYLSDSIPDSTGIDAMEGLSHYSCLFESVPKICAQLGNQTKGPQNDL
jgi:pimeloyl-ACP methyl ester carboxylesterase